MSTGEAQDKLAALAREHRELDRAIVALIEQAPGDQMAIARLKRRKLRLKDEIAQVRDQLVPDIIA